MYGRAVERVIPAAGGRRQVLRLIDELARRGRAESAPYTALADLLGRAERAIRRRSVVIVVSDFFSVPGWEPAFGRLARRHDVVAVQLDDPRERELPDIGTVLMQDAETGEQLTVDTGDRRFQARFADAVRRRDERLAATFRRAGVGVLRLSTDRDLLSTLLRFAAERERRRLRPAAGVGWSHGQGTVASG